MWKIQKNSRITNETYCERPPGSTRTSYNIHEERSGLDLSFISLLRAFRDTELGQETSVSLLNQLSGTHSTSIVLVKTTMLYIVNQKLQS